jgi:hypothetical protein
VSVQIGDIAYFINPSNVGPDKEWADTHTPHITGGQGGIIEIGRIVNIFQWDGTTSYIQCDMDQLLFNRYFAQLQAEVCPPCDSCTDGLTCSACTGNCGDRILADVPPGTYYAVQPGGWGSFVPSFYLFDNPTYDADDYMFIRLTTAGVSPLACMVLPCEDFYDPNFTNYYAYINGLTVTEDIYGPNFTSNTFTTANAFITYLIGQFPTAGFTLGMTYDEVTSTMRTVPDPVSGLVRPYPDNPEISYLNLTSSGGPVTGECTQVPAAPCDPGSFIMFSKDNKVNMSSILGYYASVELRNNSLGKAELFNVGTSFFESSK